MDQPTIRRCFMVNDAFERGGVNEDTFSIEEIKLLCAHFSGFEPEYFNPNTKKDALNLLRLWACSCGNWKDVLEFINLL